MEKNELSYQQPMEKNELSYQQPMEENELSYQQPAPEPPKYSGLLQNIFADGTIQYDDRIGLPEDFPLTEAELQEVMHP